MLSTQTAVINNIPSELLVLVLHKLTNNSTKAVREWRHKLKLLAVCRKWRVLALPLVFRHVYVNILTYIDSRNDDGSFVHKSKLITNIELITSLGYNMYPRDLTVRVEYHEPPCTQMDRILNVLSDNTLSLQKVTMLEIGLLACTAGAGNIPDTAVLDRKLSRVMAREFVKCVPNVTSFVNSPEITVANRQHQYFLRELTKQYASHIRYLKTSTLKLHSVDRFPDSLTNLHLSVCGGDAVPKACINPTMLRSLVLEDVLSNTFWSIFADGPEGSCINFNNLVSLSIDAVAIPRHMYRMRGMPSKQRGDHACEYHLAAPDLKALRFYLHPPANDVLLSISLPEYLDRLVVATGKSMIIEMASVKSNDALNCLVVRGAPEITTFYQEIELANKVFNAPNLAQHLSLTMCATEYAIPTHAISWTNLSSLTIAWRVNFVAIIALLAKTPNLTELRANSVDFIDQLGNPVLPSLQMIQKDEFEPLNTKLCRIHLYCLIFEESQDESISCITEYLRVRIATLKKLHILTPTTQCMMMM